MKLNKRVSFLALFLVIAMLFAACSGGAQTPAATEPAPAQGETAPAAEATAAPEPEGEKVLRLARSWEEASWDPCTTIGADQIALAPFIFETLCRLETDGTSSPLLAESWEVSADGLTYTFHLRKGVQWHKGYGEFTSKDVKFTFERNADESIGSVQMGSLNSANIVAIETPDDYTVVFKLGIPDVDFITRCSISCSYIVSKAAFDAVGLEGFAREPIGTGPYQFDTGTAGSQTEVVVFPEYWGGRYNIDRITNTVITDTNTTYSAFENGELDAIYVYYMDKVNEYVDKGYTATYLPSRQLLYVGVNMKIAPFDNEKVRQAFFMALNPQYYVDEIFYGKESIPSGMIPANCKYALTGYYTPEYDPAAAKALLAEAGYPDGCPITLWTVNDDISKPPALITENQLTEAGFKVEMQLVDFGVYIDKVRAGEAPMWLLYNSTSIISDDTISRYTSGRYPGSNWSGVTDKIYDDFVAQGLAATTEAEKDAAYKNAQKRFMDLRVVYSVTTYGYYMITLPEVTGIKLNGELTLNAKDLDIAR